MVGEECKEEAEEDEDKDEEEHIDPEEHEHISQAQSCSFSSSWPSSSSPWLPLDPPSLHFSCCSSSSSSSVRPDDKKGFELERCKCPDAPFGSSSVTGEGDVANVAAAAATADAEAALLAPRPSLARPLVLVERLRRLRCLLRCLECVCVCVCVCVGYWGVRMSGW